VSHNHAGASFVGSVHGRGGAGEAHVQPGHPAARHSRRSIVLSSFYPGELPELRRRSIGPDLVFGRLWQETGCRDVPCDEIAFFTDDYLPSVVRAPLLGGETALRACQSLERPPSAIGRLDVLPIRQGGKDVHARSMPTSGKSDGAGSAIPRSYCAANLGIHALRHSHIFR
jgi:hypothetical protein